MPLCRPNILLCMFVELYHLIADHITKVTVQIQGTLNCCEKLCFLCPLDDSIEWYMLTNIRIGVLLGYFCAHGPHNTSRKVKKQKNGFPELLYIPVGIKLNLWSYPTVKELKWSIWKQNINASPLLLAWLFSSLLNVEQIKWKKFLYKQNTSGTESGLGSAVSGIVSVNKR